MWQNTLRGQCINSTGTKSEQYNTTEVNANHWRLHFIEGFFIQAQKERILGNLYFNELAGLPNLF